MKKIILAAAAIAAMSATAAQADVFSYNNSKADYKCERYQYDTNAFQTPSVADSWFPETLWIDTDNFKSSVGSTQKKFGLQIPVQGGGVRFHQFTYLPKADLLLVRMNTPSGYIQPTPARYRCK